MTKSKQIVKSIRDLTVRSGISQTSLAKKSGVAVSQLNLFLNGHSGLNFEHLVSVLESLGIDLQVVIKKKFNTFNNSDDPAIDGDIDCLVYLYSSLDELGKQSFLEQLAWTSKLINKGKIPKNVEDQLKKKISLI